MDLDLQGTMGTGPTNEGGGWGGCGGGMDAKPSRTRRPTDFASASSV